MSEKDTIQTDTFVDLKRQQQYADFRAFIDEYKLAHGCIRCGYADHPAALDFDHRDHREKQTIISGMYTYSTGKLYTELEKCDVMCANCHRIKSFESGRFSPARRRAEELELCAFAASVGVQL